MKSKFCLIGKPIAHSKSPFLMKEFFMKYKKDADYILCETDRESLYDFIKTAKNEISGFNITTPLKEEILKYADFRSEATDIIGASNTALIKDGRILLYNSDYIGFFNDIRKKIKGFEKSGYAVLGCGGAARAVIYALYKANVNKIDVYIRNKEKIKGFSDFFRKNINFLDFDDEISADVIINATSLGMRGKENESPLSEERLIKSCAYIAYDLSYSPEVSKFLHMAKECGMNILNGEGMFKEQAWKSFNIWFGGDNDEFRY